MAHRHTVSASWRSMHPATLRPLPLLGHNVVTKTTSLEFTTDLGTLAKDAFAALREAVRRVVHVPDDVLERMPANGGVVMVNFIADFIAPDGPEWGASRLAESERLHADLNDEAEINRLRVRPDTSGEVVLKYLWADGLTAGPGVDLYPVETKNGVRLIGAATEKALPFTIRYGGFF